jgi:hypothetical protein
MAYKRGTSLVLERISTAITRPNIYFFASQCKNHLT